MDTQEQTIVHSMFIDFMNYVTWEFKSTKATRDDGETLQYLGSKFTSLIVKNF